MAELAPDSVVDHFRIRHLLGRGGMGAVYLARDLRLGRRVALKIIQKGRASDTGVERFLAEARTTARFAHPHIVSIYDIGEHEGSPYVALEYLEGRDLRQQLEAARLSVPHALRIVRAVADALVAAHDGGVVHRDLKPENVLLPVDGRVRVVDFGLAQHVEDIDEGSLEGTPAYMSPEQWLLDPIGPEADIWAFGVMLFEMLSGVHPYVDHADPRYVVRSPDPAPALPNAEDVPPAVVELVAACLDKDPAARPTALQVRRRVDAVLAGDHGDPDDEEDLTPFRGLLAFREDHARWFFGREAEVDRFVERLRTTCVLPVVGPSGAGKSSFVSAGVVPRLREQAYTVVIRVRPGPDPFGTLAARLSTRLSQTRPTSTSEVEVNTVPIDISFMETPFTDEEPLMTETPAVDLRRHPAALNLALHELAAASRAQVVLVVDQLEELFTLVEDDRERRAFMTALCRAAEDPGDNVRVLFTVRDDFLGRVAETEAAAQVLGQVAVIRPLGRDALEQTLRRPLAVAGYAFESDGTVEQMLDAVANEPAALPLLQFAAQALWEQRDRDARLITKRAYRAIGGVAGALATHADAVLAGLSAEQRRTARMLLLRLVTPEHTRRVLSWNDAISGLSDADPVLERLVGSRLVVVRQEEGRLVELAHESLVASWDQLARWLADAREDVRLQNDIEEAAARWERMGRHASQLWEGEPLAEARRLDVPLSERAAAFMHAAGDAEARSARRRRVAVGAAFALVLCIAVGTSVAAVEYARQSTVARKAAVEADEARARALVSGAEAALASGDPLSASARLRTALDETDTVAARGLWWRLRQQPIVWDSTGFVGHTASVTADGTRALVHAASPFPRLYDTRTGEATVLRSDADDVAAVGISPGGNGGVSVHYDGTILRWDLETGSATKLPPAELRVFDVFWLDETRFGVLGGKGRQTWVRLFDGAWKEPIRVGDVSHVRSLSPDRTVLAVASIYGGPVHLVDIGTGTVRTIGDFAESDRVGAFAWKGRELFVVGRRAHVIDLDAGEVARSYDGAPWLVAAASFAGDVLFVLDRHGVAHALDPSDGRLLDSVETGLNMLRMAATLPDGDLIAPHQDGVARVRRVSALAPRGHRLLVNHVDVAADGRIASAGADGTIRTWSTEGRELLRIEPSSKLVNEVRFHPTGNALAGMSEDHDVYLFDSRTGADYGQLHHRRAVLSGMFAPDGSHLTVVDYGGMLQRWDTSALAGSKLQEMAPTVLWQRGERLNWFGIDGNPRFTVAGGGSPELRVFTEPVDPTKPVEPRMLATGSSMTSTLSVSQAVNRVAAGGYDGVARVFDLPSGEVVVERKDMADAGRVKLSADGRWLAYSSGTTVMLERLDNGLRRSLAEQRTLVHSMAFDPTSTWLVTGDDDHTVRRWSLATGRPLWRSIGTVDGAIRTHRGWVGEPPGRWRDNVSENLVRVHTRSSRICEVEPTDDAVDTIALLDGCVFLRPDGGVSHPGGADLVGVHRIVPLVDAPGWLAVGRDRWYDGAWHEASDQLSTAGRADGTTFLGYAGGTVESIDGRRLQDPPSSPVTRILDGPPGTVVVTHADGGVGLWDASSGAALLGHQLHGAVTDVVYDPDDVELRVATLAGDSEVIDLSVFTMELPALQAEIAQVVPVIWKERVLLAE